MSLFYPTYMQLRKANPEFARKLIIDAYEKLKNISQVARLLKTTRKTVRATLKKYNKSGHLTDYSRKPKNSPNKTPPHIELIIIAERKKTGFGRDRLARILKEKGISVNPSSVRYVLKRHGLTSKYKRSKYRKRVRFYDFESLYPLSHFEVDLKEIYDKGTLSEDCISYAQSLRIPPYQWTAIDVKTRMRFISYSYEKSFTCGLIFMMTLIYFLRAFAIKHEITLQTDNGEEFGGKSMQKVEYLNRVIFQPLGVKLIHIPKGRKEYNAFVERSHQTDDNEFYIPQLELCKNLTEFMFRTLRWQYLYNIVRFHSGIGMTPFGKLCKYGNFPKKIALFPVMLLDRMVQIMDLFFPQSLQGGYYVLTNDLFRR